MSQRFTALLLLVGCAADPAPGGGGADADTGATCDSDRSDVGLSADDRLSIADGQALGTHNSYHQRPDPLATPEWDYSHRPLDEQLGDLGIRQLELDVHWNDALSRVEVYHADIVDAETSCLAWADCLETLRAWSECNPGHFPVYIMVEPKDEMASTSVQGHFDAVDADIWAVLPPEMLYTPDALAPGGRGLRNIIETSGWPDLDEMRGRFVFSLLDSGEPRDEYTAGMTSLSGRAMFAMVDRDHDLAATLKMDDPVSNFDAIQEAVAAGFIVRTRADPDPDARAAGDYARFETAMASGAQFISTDFPEPEESTGFHVAFPTDNAVVCNPVRDPTDCTPELLEAP